MGGGLLCASVGYLILLGLRFLEYFKKGGILSKRIYFWGYFREKQLLLGIFQKRLIFETLDFIGQNEVRPPCGDNFFMK